MDFLQAVRDMCEVNTCGKYDKLWSCPPGVGTLEQCRERCRSFAQMLVFSGKYELEDAFDYEGMMAGMRQFKQVVRGVEAGLRPYVNGYLMLSNEGCDLCEACTYPDAPCRHPARAHGTLEGYGIFVSELASAAGMRYNNGPNTVTYFAGMLFHSFLFET
jgi:predicted metal-binding protein